MRSEKPCNNSLCDVFSTCNEGKGVGDYRRTCHRYQRYLGQQEGQSERDALRAEVEVLKKEMEDSQSENAMLRGVLHGLLEWWPVLAKIEEAISEARKGGEG